jgi:ribonuclease HI
MPEQVNDEFWKRMSFKGNKIWVQTDENETLLLTDNKARIKYNLKQDYEYRVKPENLKPENEAVPAKKKESGTAKNKTGTRQHNKDTQPSADLPADCIQIYTDGASSGNPGPAGIGALLIYKENRKEISRSIGSATNNIAELTAIKAALDELKRRDLPVRLFTDSSYAIGVLTQGWKAKANQDLILELKQQLRSFDDIRLIKVKGHAGVEENEVADKLATSAIKKGPD